MTVLQSSTDSVIITVLEKKVVSLLKTFQDSLLNVQDIHFHPTYSSKNIIMN